MFGKSTFGSNANTSFNSPGSSLFGQNKPASNLFGQQSSPAQNSLFGQKSTTNLFGSTNATSQGSSIFGSSGQTNTSGSGTSLFGQKTTSLFGNSTMQNNSFGSSTGGTSLFGSTSGTTGGSLFGSSTSSVSGSTIKFEPLVASDTMMKNGAQQTISTKHMCITAMKAYENKSIEEVRIEDYIANRKTGNTSSGGIFGSASSGGSGLFGNTQQQAKPSLFGASSTTASPFGSSSGGTSIFGNTQNNNASQGSSLFGNKPAGGSIFGSPATSTSFGGTTSGGIFGSNTNTSFGAQQQPSSSLFGGSSFGTATSTAPATSGGFSFGATNTANSTFGQPASSTGSIFGSSTTATSGLFGKPAGQTGFSFGSTPASGSTTFGQTAGTTGGGLFGNTASKPGGLFGSTTTSGGSLFGNQPAQNTTGSVFGNTQPASQQGSLFGSNTGSQPANTFGVVTAPTTVSVPTAAPIVLGSDVNQTQVQMALLDAQIAASPYGDSPLLKLATVKDSEEKPNPTSVQRQMRFLAAKNVITSPLNGSNSVNSPTNNSINGKSFLSAVPSKVMDQPKSIRNRSSAIPGRDLNYTSSVIPPTLGKGLRTKAPTNFSGLSTSNRSLNGSLINKTIDLAIETSLSGNANRTPVSGRKTNLKHLDLSAVDKAITSRPIEQERDPDELPPVNDSVIGTQKTDRIVAFSPDVDPRVAALQRDQMRRNDPPRLVLDGSACEETTIEDTPVIQPSEVVKTAGGVTLKSSDYYCEPTINAMRDMIVDGKVVLPNGLTVGRATFGSVFWPGHIELENIVIDDIVVFRHKEVTVYPDESKKPALGEGLNRPAEVTLERVWHTDRVTKEEVRDPLKLADLGWRDRLENVTARMGATFKDYRPDTGSWVFRVEHFSKYGLPDDEGDQEIHPSTAELNQSLIDQQLQGKVQRTKVNLVPPAVSFMDTQVAVDTDMEMLTSDRVDFEHKQSHVGLGGGLLQVVSTDGDDMSESHSSDDWMDKQVPEKKPKLEDMDYLFEESKRLRDILSTPIRPLRRLFPKCSESTRQFSGGIKAKNSICNCQSTIIDSACVRGGVSRVNWCVGSCFTFSLQPASNHIQISTLEFESDISEDLISDMLEHNIRLSQLITRNLSTSGRMKHCELEGQTTAPRIKPTGDHAQLLDSFLATAKQSHRKRDQRVWQLCQALFPVDQTGRWRWDRSDAVGDWIRCEVANLPKITQEGRGSSVWSALCFGLINEAIECAITERLHHLASMLSIFSVDPLSTRQDFAAQVEFWDSEMMLQYIDVNVLKVYLVMAGKSNITFIKNGQKEIINCMEDLDWKQALGMHVWWLRGAFCLEDAFEAFCEDVDSGRAASPNNHIYEQLIRLACNPAQQVEAVIDAAGMLSDSPLDVHLSWHLWTVLRSVGYNTMRLDNEQRLHMAYGEQLAALGVWHLAVFVLSHISHDQCRSLAIRELLNRIAMVAQSADYKRILSVCQIPSEWIAAARFIRAKSVGNNERACELAIDAGDFVTAHRIFTEEVAPNAIAIGDLNGLKKLCERMEGISAHIHGWGANGQIYVDYCHLKTLGIEEEDDDRLQQLIESIETRIHAPIFKTYIQRLCVQTMARELFEIQKMSGKINYSLPMSQKQLEKLVRQLL